MAEKTSSEAQKKVYKTYKSANSYIKALIKADLDAKGFNMDCAAMLNNNVDYGYR